MVHRPRYLMTTSFALQDLNTRCCPSCDFTKTASRRKICCCCRPPCLFVVCRRLRWGAPKKGENTCLSSDLMVESSVRRPMRKGLVYREVECNAQENCHIRTQYVVLHLERRLLSS
jgi:hypothetical protein